MPQPSQANRLGSSRSQELLGWRGIDHATDDSEIYFSSCNFDVANCAI